jgi:hypothetical protein
VVSPPSNSNHGINTHNISFQIPALIGHIPIITTGQAF